jgi:hypothetical protein
VSSRDPRVASFELTSRTRLGTAHVDTVMRFIALIALVLVGAACGASETRGTVRTPLHEVEALRVAPAWVRVFCREASSVTRGEVLCPGRLPRPFGPGPNAGTFRPSRFGYVVEGYTESHWVFAAFPARSGFEGYGRLRTLGTARVAGRPARYLFSATAGISAGHEILSWRQGGFVYAVSVHTGEPKRPSPAALLQVARAMRRY